MEAVLITGVNCSRDQSLSPISAPMVPKLRVVWIIRNLGLVVAGSFFTYTFTFFTCTFINKLKFA